MRPRCVTLCSRYVEIVVLARVAVRREGACNAPLQMHRGFQNMRWRWFVLGRLRDGISWIAISILEILRQRAMLGRPCRGALHAPSWPNLVLALR